MLSAQLISRLVSIFGIRLQELQPISTSQLNPYVTKSLLRTRLVEAPGVAVMEIGCEQSQPTLAVYLR